MSGEKSGFKVKVQQFGSFLSGMIMPNIGAFIAWGLITALFIPKGYFPNADIAKLVDPTIKYLLPILIGYTGGKLVYDVRGGVVGAMATMGVVVGSDVTMFLGAMIVGPLTAWLMKKTDKLWEGKIKAGFEMLVNNFSAGILSGILAIIGLLGIGPAVEAIDNVLAAGVEGLMNIHLLPLVSLFVEPAKVLFLNNAINHGVLSPIALEQAHEAGKSLLFLVEANPGPGLGILLAYSFFGKGSAKQTAPGAIIIQFLGGIHEIYFPYILMKPILILAAMAGGVTGIATLTLFHAGLVGVVSPGSIIAVYAMTARTDYVGVTLAVLFAALVSFLVAALLLKTSKQKDTDLSAAESKMQEMKGKKAMTPSDAVATQVTDVTSSDVLPKDPKLIIFACDAGMGSSAMGASVLRNKIKKAGMDIEVKNTAISQLPGEAEIVVTHQDLTPRAKEKLPNAYHVSVENFLNSSKYDELVDELKNNQ